ncbi:MAG: hypothetical protein FJ116_10545 [Deltaproteobacteria bacterium]|nr:hypothetical protein [Deltaproteobacteria bacterium]
MRHQTNPKTEFDNKLSAFSHLFFKPVKCINFIPRFHKIFCFILALITCSTFVFALYRWFNAPGTPIHNWDEVDYYRSAALFYESPSFQNLWQSARPNYMWLPALFLKAFGISLTASRISAVTSCLAWGILLTSLFQGSKLLESGSLFFLFSLSLLFSLPTTFLYSVEMLADFIHAATFVALSVASLNLIKNGNSSQKPLLTYIIVGSFGLFTKPVFFMPALIVTGFTVLYSLSESSFSKKTKIELFLGAVAFIALTLCVALRYRGLISSLYFNNEVLGYWIRSTKIFFQLFWYPIELVENLCVGHLLGFFLLAVMWLLKSKKEMSLKDLKLSLLVWGPWLLMLLYTSLVVRQKDIRVFLFLFVFLFVFFPLWLGNSIKHLKGVQYLLSALITINTLIVISLTFPKKFHSFFSEKPNLAQRKFIHSEFLSHPFTYEDAKIDDLFQLIRSDCLKRENLCSTTSLSIFLPHSGRINTSVLTDYSLFFKKDSKPISEWTPAWKIQSGLFRFGGWFLSGGIPSSFFSSDYIIYYPQISATHLTSDAELYNKIFHEKLRDQTSIFLDGLEEIARLDSTLGPIYILRRNHIPSVKSFIKIVGFFQTIDPDNWWNHPYLDAVDKLKNSKSKLLITNLDRLKGKEPTPEYTKVWNFPPPGDYSYPEFLKKINLNP